MAEAILLAVSKIGAIVLNEAVLAVINKLSRKVDNLKELPAKIKRIDIELKTMNDVIQDLGTTHLSNNVVKGWIGNVRRLAYHVEDVIDKYSYEALKLKDEGFLNRYAFRSSRHIKVFSKIAEEVIEIEGEIRHIKELHIYWSTIVQPIRNEHAEIDRQRWGGCFPESVSDEDLVGIDENRSKLTEWLTTSEKETTVVTVSGMGGLGKTTLVKNVYDREKANFPDAHAWIVVSRVYAVVDLLKALLTKIQYTQESPPPSPLSPGAKADVYELTEAIKKILQNKKCLIVLDDVWDKEAYTQMCSAFQGLQGSRVMITTRKEDVAALAPVRRRLLLQPLGSVESFKLFCSRAFHNSLGRKCPPELEAVAAAIVDRLFREDYEMSRENLVRLWVAEGFAKKKDNSTPEEVAEGNLMELIGRNMLEVVERDELFRVSTCKMHDIVRDLALAVAKEERFGSASDQGEMTLMDKEVRRFSTCGWRDSMAAAPGVDFPRLRTVISLSAALSSTNMISSVLSGSNYLTVLELQDSAICHVPASIGNLFNLRYIGLRRTRVQSLPDTIEKLSNLETLDVKQTKIEKLPPGIVKVEKLRHLLADRYADEKQTKFQYFVGVEAPNMISNFQELQTLETVHASKDLSLQLKKMNKLQTVWVDNIDASNCDDLFKTLSDMPLLSSLLLCACDEKETLTFQALKPISKRLHRLIIRGGWADGTLKCPIFQGHGKNIKYLALSWCNLGNEDPLQLLASHLSALTYLSLNRVSSAGTLVLSAGCFCQLKTLVLRRMPNVKQLEIEEGAIPCIGGIYIMSLSEVSMVPRGIESLGSLKKLWMLDLHKDFKADWDLNQMHDKMTHVPELRA
uniref:Disease resistance protein RPM1 n=1 Tax=Aegilops tauschii subsp. strangulata TaxID=200361 RepID=A0A452XLM9_AEGTS